MEKSHRVVELDGLRGFAILIVLVSHFSDYGLLFYNFTGIGKIGVYLFFVLSSFLLDGQIIEFYKNTSKYVVKEFWKNYFVRRVLRIIPLYIIILTINFTLEYHRIRPSITIGGVTGFIHHILMVKGEFVFWSIPIEFRYYIISPLLILLFKILRWNFVGVSLISFFLIVLGRFFYVINDFEFLTLKYLPPFIIGTYIAYLNSFYKNIVHFFNVKLVALIAILAMCLPFLLVPMHYGVEKFFFHPYILVISLFLAVLLIYVLYATKMVFIKNIFRSHILTFLGKISFSLYLFHVNIIYVVLMFFKVPKSIQFFLATFLVISLSYLSYKMIELPLSKIRVKYEKI